MLAAAIETCSAPTNASRPASPASSMRSRGGLPAAIETVATSVYRGRRWGAGRRVMPLRGAAERAFDRRGDPRRIDRGEAAEVARDADPLIAGPTGQRRGLDRLGHEV